MVGINKTHTPHTTLDRVSNSDTHSFLEQPSNFANSSLLMGKF